MSHRKSKKVDITPVTLIRFVPLAGREACVGAMATANYFLWYEEVFERHVRLVFMLAS